MARKRSEATIALEQATGEVTQERATKSIMVPLEPVTPLFVTSGRQRLFPDPGHMGHGFHTVVQDIYAQGLDVMQEYQAVQKALTLHGALDPAALLASANQVEDTARRAHKLLILAKAEYEHYIRRTDSIVGSVRESATVKLEEQKRSGARTKQITDADVAGACAQYHADEWEDLNTRRDKAKGMVAHVEKLAELATIRCRTIGSMLAARGSKL